MAVRQVAGHRGHATLIRGTAVRTGEHDVVDEVKVRVVLVDAAGELQPRVAEALPDLRPERQVQGATSRGLVGVPSELRAARGRDLPVQVEGDRHQRGTTSPRGVYAT